MGSAGVRIVCVSLGVLGLIGVIVCCAVPHWTVTTFTNRNCQTQQSEQSVMEGLWMSCVVQRTGQLQCKNYDPLLVLSSDLQAARPMTIISCMLSCLSLLILFCGAVCVQNKDAKPKISLVAGIGLMLAGLLVIIPVSWSAHIVLGFNNPEFIYFQKKELGACIFVGWGAGVLLLLAGGLLCCFSRHKSGSSGGTTKYYSNNSGPNKNYM